MEHLVQCSAAHKHNNNYYVHAKSILYTFDGSQKPGSLNFFISDRLGVREMDISLQVWRTNFKFSSPYIYQSNGAVVQFYQ